MLYSTGVVMIFGTFLLLYRYARTLTEGMPAAEAVDMRFAARASSALLGLTSVSIAAIGYFAEWEPVAGIAGAVYFPMGPLHAWNGRQLGRAKERIVGA
jgi:hypothetical protein